jgi:hypothetical protein
VKELSEVSMEMLKVVGTVLEQEPLRFINMITAVGSSGGALGGQGRYAKGVVEHKVVQNLSMETRVYFDSGIRSSLQP